MKYTQKKQNNTLTITFKTTSEEWAQFNVRAYEQNKGKYNVPGFRKGHVPKSVLENRYGKELFFEDALYIAAQEYYTQFLDKNKKVYPVARPTLDSNAIKMDETGLTFAVVVTVKPEITLGQYKGLTVAKTEPAKVTDEDVNAELNRTRERNARFVEITDRAVAQGDQVNLDFLGKVDGVAFEGGEGKDYKLEIGSHSFIDGFEDQLVGMTIGQTADINVTFPKEYHAENLAGKDAVFTVTINAINVKELPKLDDDFAKDVSEFATLDEYKADIAKHIAERYEKEANDKNEDAVIEAVVNATPIDIPAEMIDEQVEQYVEDFKYQLSYQGLKLEDYLKYTNSTIDALKETYRDRAQKAVHTRLVFEEIVKAEKLKAGKKQVDAKIKQYAERMGKSYDEFSATLREEDKYYFENQVISEQLIALLKEQNTIA